MAAIKGTGVVRKGKTKPQESAGPRIFDCFVRDKDGLKLVVDALKQSGHVLFKRPNGTGFWTSADRLAADYTKIGGPDMTPIKDGRPNAKKATKN